MAGFDVKRWLRRALEVAQGDPRTVSLELSDRLEAVAMRYGIRLLSDIWISSQYEEAEVPIIRRDGNRKLVRVCLVPLEGTSIYVR